MQLTAVSSMKRQSPSHSPGTARYPMPLVRIDLVLLTVIQGRLQVMLSQREKMPFQGQWGLPGGVLRIDQDISLEDAAQRVAQERLLRELSNLRQVVTVGGANRDPRAPWAMTVVYGSLVPPDLEVIPGKRVQALSWWPVDDLTETGPLAFDHSALIQMAVEQIRQDVRDLRYPKGVLPEHFTLPELQTYSEAILGSTLDKVTFRRRIVASQMLESVPEIRRGGAHRPAQVYRFS